MNIRSTWLKRIEAPSPFCPIAPKGTTYVELVSAVPFIQDDGRASVNVIGRAEGAKYHYNGYINKEHSNGVFEILKKAQEDKEFVLMRFERQRKEGSDPNASIQEITADKEIAKDNVFRVLTAIYDFKNDRWLPANNVISDLKNDPPEIKEFIDTWVIDKREDRMTPEDFFKKEEKTPSHIQKGSTFDKEQQLLAMYFFLADYEKKNEVALTKEERQKLSKVLLNMADRIQLKIVDIEEPNYRDYSHTRARYVLFSVADMIVPLLNNFEDGKIDMSKFKGWVEKALNESYSIIEWSKEV